MKNGRITDPSEFKIQVTVSGSRLFQSGFGSKIFQSGSGSRLFSPDLNPGFAESGRRIRSMLFSEKILNKFQLIKRTLRLQEKLFPFSFFLFWGTKLACLDQDSAGARGDSVAQRIFLEFMLFLPRNF
jgi:hypothetical protein